VVLNTSIEKKYSTTENLVLRAKSELNGFAGKDCELFWSIGVSEIPNNKSQISNKSQ
jgi:hypothetical protein